MAAGEARPGVGVGAGARSSCSVHERRTGARTFKENTMHDIESTQGESDLTGLEAAEPEGFEYNFEQDGATELQSESPFGEIEETELAEELLTVQSEEELDQFLGKLVKKAWRGVKKFAKSGV